MNKITFVNRNDHNSQNIDIPDPDNIINYFRSLHPSNAIVSDSLLYQSAIDKYNKEIIFSQTRPNVPTWFCGKINPETGELILSDDELRIISDNASPTVVSTSTTIDVPTFNIITTTSITSPILSDSNLTLAPSTQLIDLRLHLQGKQDCKSDTLTFSGGTPVANLTQSTNTSVASSKKYVKPLELKWGLPGSIEYDTSKPDWNTMMGSGKGSSAQKISMKALTADPSNIDCCPKLAFNPNPLTATCLIGENAPDDVFIIGNEGCGNLLWSLNTINGMDWLTVYPLVGDLNHPVHKVYYNTSKLIAGTYLGTISVTANTKEIGSLDTMLIVKNLS